MRFSVSKEIFCNLVTWLVSQICFVFAFSLSRLLVSFFISPSSDQCFYLTHLSTLFNAVLTLRSQAHFGLFRLHLAWPVIPLLYGSRAKERLSFTTMNRSSCKENLFCHLQVLANSVKTLNWIMNNRLTQLALSRQPVRITLEVNCESCMARIVVSPWRHSQFPMYHWQIHLLLLLQCWLHLKPDHLYWVSNVEKITLSLLRCMWCAESYLTVLSTDVGLKHFSLSLFNYMQLDFWRGWWCS